MSASPTPTGTIMIKTITGVTKTVTGVVVAGSESS